MPCPVCAAQTRSNRPCKRHTCKFAPKCHQHTKVVVKPSDIAGRGLFARAPIRKNEIVGDYTVGTQRLTPLQFASKYTSGRATHVWAPRNKSVYYDAIDASKSVAGMANRAPRGRRNNAKITNGGRIKALAQIPQGRELLVAYGAAYRL